MVASLWLNPKLPLKMGRQSPKLSLPMGTFIL